MPSCARRDIRWTVRSYLAEERRLRQEAFVPLIWRPGGGEKRQSPARAAASIIPTPWNVSPVAVQPISPP